MLKGLLHDKVPTVQQTAALAVGRMAGFSTELSEELVTAGILEQLTASMRGSLPGHMKAGAFVIRSVAKHGEDLCGCCLDAGCASTLTHCMEQLDTSVREAAAQSIATLALHCAPQAEAVVQAGALPLLVAALQEPEPALKKAAAAALGEVAKHSPELADAVVSAGALGVLTALLRHPEPKVRRQACSTLAQVVKHTPPLAESAVEANMFPVVLVCMQDSDETVRRNAAICVREVVKHSEQLASVVVECGGVGSCVEFITSRARGTDRLAAVMALGFIAAYSEGLAARVVDAAGVPALKDVLLGEGEEDHVRAAAVWALGQTGRHTPTHARALAEGDVLRHVQAALLAEESSDDLREKSKRCLKAVVAQCDHVMALQSLLATAPGNIVKVILRQLTSVLRDDNEQRKQFLASGGLKLVQVIGIHGPGTGLAAAGGGATMTMGRSGAGGGATRASRGHGGAEVDPEIVDLVTELNGCYPAEVVAYCRPDYMEKLAAKIHGDAQEENRAARKQWIASQAGT
jgi:3-methyladenine DNA glycosylase AlkD